MVFSKARLRGGSKLIALTPTVETSGETQRVYFIQYCAYSNRTVVL